VSAHLIGVGPGAADLLTVRASRVISHCGTCLFAGDSISREVLALCPPEARTVDTTGMSPRDVVAEMRSAYERGDRVVYLHSGDPAAEPAMAEQLRALDAEGIGWQIIPGLPVFAAAGAALGIDLTAASGAGSVFITQVDDPSDPLPTGGGPASTALTDGTAVFHVRASELAHVVRGLLPTFGPDRPAGVVVSAGREDQATVAGTLRDIAGRTPAADPSRDVVMVVGRALEQRMDCGTASTRDAAPAPAPAPAPTTAPLSTPTSAATSRPLVPVPAPSSTRVPAVAPGRILVLGGTGEARRLADLMVTAGLDVVTSLAGSVSRPRLPRGEVRIGGFGGSEGLAHWLRENEVSAVIDATDPYATAISSSALRAAQQTGVPLLRVHRPPWTPEDGESWIRVPDTEAAARLVRERFRRPMLTVGRQGPTAFAGDTRGSYLIRCAEPPPGPLPHRYLLVLDRGPFDVESERAIMSRHRIDVLVTRNSGGPNSVAKLRAARDLRIPVVMVDRPIVSGTGGMELAETVDSVDDAARWLVRRFGSR
jgi:precorrin-6x reductase